ncbi:MAG: hypothetical protein A4E53_04306 [Pelotomaculum sp. PtaB.Bin104]|nr:MAG: hypothetical protein A4E53_04306 [Pelotomaculum sp. PtaB.Bin104]
MRKRVLPMSHLGVHPAGQRVKTIAIMIRAAGRVTDKTVKCTRLPAMVADKLHGYHSSQMVPDQYTAATVSATTDVTLNNILGSVLNKYTPFILLFSLNYM